MKGGEVTSQTAFRLPVELLDRVDEYAEIMKRRLPGVKVTRADAVRTLLVRGLEDARRTR